MQAEQDCAHRKKQQHPPQWRRREEQGSAASHVCRKETGNVTAVSVGATLTKRASKISNMSNGSSLPEQLASLRRLLFSRGCDDGGSL
jgi:hypothetical protein